MATKSYFFVFIFYAYVSFLGSRVVEGAVSSRIACESEHMLVDIRAGHSIDQAYLIGLKDYPDLTCKPERLNEGHLRFRISYKQFYRCGTSQILNKMTGKQSYYNRIIIEAQGEKYNVFVKCQRNPGATLIDNNSLNYTSLRYKRDVLPAGFKEPEDVTIIQDKIGYAPEPMLSMVVKQDGRIVGQELIVQPGAPLTMEVALDDLSKDIYGILMSQLDVNDITSQSELILYNGCSVDPYLFENFETRNGDKLTAQFRAFKFPDSNYVLFRGTVTVCLGNCEGTPCSNGQLGYGRRRRRRSVSEELASNPMYEARIATLVRIGEVSDSEDLDLQRVHASGLNSRFIIGGGQGMGSSNLQQHSINAQADFVTAPATAGSSRNVNMLTTLPVFLTTRLINRF